MPLNAVRYLVPGLVAGLVAFVFSRLMIAPLIAAAIEYEGAREHAEEHLGGGHSHGHELFTRAVQENLGAATGIVMFGVIMGVLFAVAYGVLRTVLERRGFQPDQTALALLLAAGMFVAVALFPDSSTRPTRPASAWTTPWRRAARRS